jgi:ferrochelatase
MRNMFSQIFHSSFPHPPPLLTPSIPSCLFLLRSKEFLFNLFADPDIIRLPGPLVPLQNLIAAFIAKRRAPKSRAAYESIGGGSPILQYTNAQAKLLSESFSEKYGMPIKTYVGMRYWKPYTEEALAAIRRDKIKALVILPLYPQFSISTSGSSLRVLQEDFSKEAASYGDMVHTVVPSWYDRPGYVTAMSNLIQNEIDSFTDSEKADAKTNTPNLTSMHVLFSAHGVPKSYIEAGDPYQKQMEKCVEGIKAKLYETNSPEDLTIHLSYQSRVGPIEWLRPVSCSCMCMMYAVCTHGKVASQLFFVHFYSCKRHSDALTDNSFHSFRVPTI